MSNIINFKTTVDYASLVIHVTDESHQDQIIQRIRSTGESLASFFKHPFKTLVQNPKNYRYQLALPMDDAFKPFHKNNEVPHLRIYASPYDEHRSFLRLELKGHPYCDEKWAFANLWLDCLLGDAGEMYLNSRRLKLSLGDIAVDVGVPISALSVCFSNIRKTGAYWNSGQLETYYLGTTKNCNRVCIYNRLAKMQSLLKNSITGKAETRIEFRLKFNCFLDQLSNKHLIQKIIKRIDIYDLVQMEKCGTFLPQTIHLFRNIGIQTILQTLDAEEKRRLRKKLKPFKLGFIKSDVIQTEMQTALARLENLYSSNQPLERHKKVFKSHYPFIKHFI